MSFNLAFWHENQPITAEQAQQIYRQLCVGNDTIITPHPNIALFVQELAQLYPPINDYPEEKLDECPWSRDWDLLTRGSAVLCMTYAGARAIAPLLIQIANDYDLVCFDPQGAEVYFPPSLDSPDLSQ